LTSYNLDIIYKSFPKGSLDDGHMELELGYQKGINKNKTPHYTQYVQHQFEIQSCTVTLFISHL
jgi:hypothetical protein